MIFGFEKSLHTNYKYSVVYNVANFYLDVRKKV